MSENSLSILCFGDSLTQGFHNYGLGESPYSETLEKRLKAAFPDTEIRIRTSGVPGDVASSSSFQRRFSHEVDADSYDWVIILGGTNDLGRLVAVDRVIEALRSYWNKAIRNGSKVLALTVPECKAKPEWLETNRHELNQQILTHSHPNFYAFDLYSHLPYHSLAEAERDLYWDDGLHLTADGYEWMGEHIANGLIRILQQEAN
ncbi:SGNH hydrolase-type esterase domain-containing protein [Dactylonectria estremocensis]|uniref:SGNH hydrolase-type esterase domain-containing protein n=1 Tax=Dactylonectria estremocensis TaxID=1079267 RepID=A0A9P9DZT3_9HYPO|nr:SGNH hydrolase-type esterase domain-containing protein [Dactylonectria estremocensis]